MKQKQSKYKRQNIIIISIVVATILLFGGIASFRAYQVKQHQVDVEQDARQEIALWMVQNCKFKEPVKSLEFTPFTKPNIFGGGDYSSKVRINHDDHKVIQVSVEQIKPIHLTADHGVSMLYNSKIINLNPNNKVDKTKNLDHIQIGTWNQNK